MTDAMRILPTFRALAWLMLAAAPFAGAEPFAFVPNAGHNTVTVIDTADRSLFRVLGVGGGPRGVAVWSNGRTAAGAYSGAVYVTNFDDGTVSWIPVPQKRVYSHPIPVGRGPMGIAVSPDGGEVYVANQSDGTVTMICTDDWTTQTVPVGAGPTGVAVHPGGGRVYVANQADGSVSVLDAESLRTLAVVRGFAAPYAVAAHPDGSAVYVTNRDGASVSVIDTKKDRLVKTLALGATPNSLSLSPDGARLYVALDSGELAVIDTRHSRVVDRLPTGDVPSGVTVHPNGRSVWFTSEASGNVSLVDLSSRAVSVVAYAGVRPVALGQFIVGVLQTIDIEVATNGEDADSPPGPTLAVGSPVHWTYTVTNLAEGPLSDITVIDRQGAAVSCPAATLAGGASMVCTASGVALPGQYENVGEASGIDFLGHFVVDIDFSHYFGEVVAGGGQGCTPGYWKQPHHFDSWPPTLSPGQPFGSVFADAFPGKSLRDVLAQGGGGLNALGRHSVAALLNASSPRVSFDLLPTQVIQRFDAAFPGSNNGYESLKNEFEELNEQGCPLN